MQAIIATDRDAALAGMTLSDVPYPHMAENDVVVECTRPGSPLVS
jgi:hypothetical protein